MMSIYALENGQATMECIYCGRSLGPVFRDVAEAERFEKWLPQRPRSYSKTTLDSKLGEFRAQDKGAEG